MSWSNGLAQWREGSTHYISVAFTWRLDDAFQYAKMALAEGLDVIAGGPALFLVQNQHRLADVALILKDYPDAVRHHNPDATFASRGCPKNCWWCLVPKMEGNEFTLLPEFPIRPILCDNNLSALDPRYQDLIIERYHAAGIPLRDANSGFEPDTFLPDVYERWKPLINSGKGPWRFAYDEIGERNQVRAVMRMLANEPQRRKRVYVLIGNEPFSECMQRIQEVIDMGCEPHVQPFIKLNSLERVPHVRLAEKYDWSVQKLMDVARWANGWAWKKASFSDYDRSKRTKPFYDAQQGLFTEIAA